MNHFAILCGSAPEGFRQKKLEDMFDFLTRPEGGSFERKNIISFPGGVNELFLENLLWQTIEKASEDSDSYVLLYLCAKSEADLHAELSDSAISGVEIVRLGENEIRKEVLAYYAGLAEKLDVAFKVDFSVDGDFVSEKSLGYEVLEMNQLAEQMRKFD